MSTDVCLLLPAGQIAFVSGAAAAVGSGVVKVPIAVCIRSVQAGIYPDVFAAARSITKAAGVRGLFTVSADTC
jgi:solute carrier family 25 S-adenosylmethionine transporter 26